MCQHRACIRAAEGAPGPIGVGAGERPQGRGKEHSTLCEGSMSRRRARSYPFFPLSPAENTKTVFIGEGDIGLPW